MALRLSKVLAAVYMVLMFCAGCSETARRTDLALDNQAGERVSMSVEFPDENPLKYKVVSRREMVLDFDPSRRMSKPGSNPIQEMTEEAELTLEYKAVGKAERGGTLVQVKCTNAAVRRARLTGGTAAADALATLSGHSFTMKVSASGQILDTGEIEKVIHDLGEAAFGGRDDRYEGRRIKNPDMIADFIAVQWYMWDQQQSIPRPASGVALGQEWSSRRRLLAPFPFVARTGRDATYTLAEVQRVDGDVRAVITSTYTLAESPSMDWPLPYSGSFSQRGSFGFFHSYNVQELVGEGTQVFDVTEGRILTDEQHYTAKVSAVIPFGGLGKDGESPEPNITVRQVIRMELLPAETTD